MKTGYRPAAALFTEATENAPDGPWPLHQLATAPLTHAAEDGASTSTLMAYFGHTSVRSLARYARVSRGTPCLAGTARSGTAQVTAPALAPQPSPSSPVTRPEKSLMPTGYVPPRP
jgi:hypothetical protein